MCIGGEWREGQVPCLPPGNDDFTLCLVAGPRSDKITFNSAWNKYFNLYLIWLFEQTLVPALGRREASPRLIKLT